jgi:hypothetical protein
MNFYRYTNPKMTGVVVKEAVKCGKENCRCNNGFLHKWYYYLYYRSFEGGKWKLKKEYLSQSKAKYLKRKIKEFKLKSLSTRTRLSTNTPYLTDVQAYLNGSISMRDLLKSAYEIA